MRNKTLLIILQLFAGLVMQAQTVVTIGTQVLQSGTSGISPYNYYWESRRVQFVYTATEILGAGGFAGDISAIAFDVSQVNGGDLVNYTVRMAHTSATDASTHNTAPLTTVKNAHTLTPGTTGWRTIAFDNNFLWNGTDNILVDVCWGVNSGWESNGQVWLYNDVANQMRGIYSSTANQCGAATNTARNGKPRVQFTFLPPANMSIQSSNTLQVTSYAFQGGTDQAVIALNVVTSGSANPLVVNSVTFTTSGTTNTTDLLSAKAYFTTSPTFSTANPFGTAISNPSGTLTFNGSQTLTPGNTNYFWLAYDISPTAQIGNVVDGTCTQFTTTESNTYIPTTTDPAGNRIIRTPLAGTYTIDNSNPTNVNSGGTNFNNFDDALFDLNSLGHSGPVTFNVPAGQTFNKTIVAPDIYAYYIMNYIGSAANPVVFQKTGAGANPVLSITGTSATNNIGMFLYGCDYVTFNGIDIVDAGTSSADYLDWGYYLQGPVDNNCDHVTIQNCTIDLNKNNTSARGIYTFANAPSISSNGNVNNLFANNTINDAYVGIWLAGNGSFPDLNNTVNGNTITNLGNNLSTTVNGIFINNQGGFTVSGNNIQNLSGSVGVNGINITTAFGNNVVNQNTISGLAATGTTTMYGIYASTSTTANNDIWGNTVHSISHPGANVHGIFVTSGTTNNIYNNNVYNISYTGTGSLIAHGITLSGGTTSTIYNNFIYDIKAPASTGTPGVRALNLNGGTTANVYHNTVYIDYTSTAATNQSAALYVTTSPTTLNLQNNIFVNNSDVTTGTRAVAFYKSTTSIANLANTNNNNLFYAGTPGTKNLIYYDGTNSYQTLSAFKTAMAPRESSSVTENPPFTSTTAPYDLHFPPGASTLAESGGASTSVGTDFDGNIRFGHPGYSGSGLAPDIGADEFEGENPEWVSLDMGATALVAPATTGCYGASETVTVTIKNYGTSIMNFAVNNVTVNVAVTGAVNDNLSTTLTSGILGSGATMNVNVGTLDMTTAGTYTFNANTNFAADGNPSNDAMAPATRTVIAPLAIPYTEDFEDNQAQGWNTAGWIIGASNHGNPGNGLYKNLWSSAPTGQFTIAKVGPVTATDNLVFDYRILNWSGYPNNATPNTPAWGNIQIDISTNCGASFAPFATIDPSNHVSTTDWVTKTYSLASYVGQDVIFRFTATWSAGDYYVDFDNFAIQTPPSCPTPTALTATNITTTSADLGWTENGSATQWEIEWGPQGFTQGTGTTITVTNNPYTLTGLSAATSYSFYVRADCGGGNYSNWAGPQNFTTQCDAFTLPFSESFASPSFPTCWTQTYSGGITSNRWSVSITNNAGGTANEMVATYTSGIGVSRLITPAINTVGQTSLNLSFKTFYDDYGPGATLRVQTSTDGNTWINSSWSYASGSGDIPASTITITLTQGLNSPTTYIAWTIDGDHYQFDYWYVDDVSLTQPPACPAPTALTATNITSTSADLGWTENGSATQWEIEYGASGFAQGSGTTVTATTNPYPLSGLTPNTSYDFYVRADCGGNGNSTWTGPQSFTTAQTPATLPYSQDFEVSAADLTFVNGTQPNKWQVGTATQNGGIQSAYVSNDGGTTNAYTITSSSVVHFYRDITFTAGAPGFEVKFDWKGMGEVGWDFLKVYLVDLTTTPVAGTQLPVANQIGATEYNNSNTWQTATINLPGTLAGTTKRLVFSWRNDAVLGTQPPAAVDNIVVAAQKTLDVTVFLEGPFNGTDMNTDLLTGNLIPLSQPYNTAPWNYAGTESVVAIPANVVDWVLVELRDADLPANATPATTLPGWPKAMFLRNDGQIVGLDGNLPNIGNPTLTNNLFVVVRHRNHLDVMSNTGATLSGSTYSYNFSTGINQAYGGNAGYKEIVSGVFGMVSGEADADGQTFMSDFNLWAADFGNSNTYMSTDFDLDGSVFMSDYNKWTGNFGFNNVVNSIPRYRSQVPNERK